MVTAISQQAFRQVLGRFATGVTVISVGGDDGSVHAMTANAFSSLSLDPPLVLICLDKQAKTLRLIRERLRFAINILADDQENLSRLFANQAVQQTPSFCFSCNNTLSPVLDGALANIDCKLFEEYDGGDHVIIVGEVLSAMMNEDKTKPLCFFKGQYCRLA
ncbi:flavin reductase family protein [Alicyclobacillus vulcanalis]|uniref:3-hydroxy-9,10-secoandrosta-1,3,5(10)-triene-9,17-dione monooxygenase reductase component n=1 Tax=Alicyclobacillus vulcanalis TaxID=252246 RepID=A0A1N7NX82_9BACL|nr:flavin reductase family protein [Alicyclobacillus vulcanalis]SIT02891.1 3-hydroxy-9,10-secoandrosta-1,3,5(10)-triene-9,17-dione monooxygenase reductase component [Alicyclobacillus vulcanalis]